MKLDYKTLGITPDNGPVQQAVLKKAGYYNKKKEEDVVYTETECRKFDIAYEKPEDAEYISNVANAQLETDRKLVPEFATALFENAAFGDGSNTFSFPLLILFLPLLKKLKDIVKTINGKPVNASILGGSPMQKVRELVDKFFTTFTREYVDTTFIKNLTMLTKREMKLINSVFHNEALIRGLINAVTTFKTMLHCASDSDKATEDGTFMEIAEEEIAAYANGDERKTKLMTVLVKHIGIDPNVCWTKGALPDMSKWSSKLKISYGPIDENGKPTITEKVDRPTPETVPDFFPLYRRIIERLLVATLKRASEVITKSYTALRVPYSTIEHGETDPDAYYDMKIKLQYLPAFASDTGVSHDINVYMHTQFKDTDYMPAFDDRDGMFAEHPKPMISVPTTGDYASLVHDRHEYPKARNWEEIKSHKEKVAGDAESRAKHRSLNNYYSPRSKRECEAQYIYIPVSIKRPKLLMNPEYISQDAIMGCDVNLVTFALMTSIEQREVPNMMDWSEAFHAYRKAKPNAVIFNPPKDFKEGKIILRHITDINNVADDYTNPERADRHMAAIPMFFLGNVFIGKNASGKWMASYDYLGQFFRFLTKRRKDDGTLFYDKVTRHYIGQSYLLRKLIIQARLNYSRYREAQSILDLQYPDANTRPRLSSTDAGKHLLDERGKIRDKIDTCRAAIFAYILDNVPEGRHQICSLEDLMLGSCGVEHHTKSLYKTAKEDWHMCPGSLSVTPKTGEIRYTPPTVGFLPTIVDTEFWHCDPNDVHMDGDTQVYTATATEKFHLVRERDIAWDQVKKAFSPSSVKNQIERMCTKRGLKCMFVNPKNTSKICHWCHNELFLNTFNKKTGKLKASSYKEAMAKHVNWRDGRDMSCGNPDCPFCGKIQNADENSSCNMVWSTLYIYKAMLDKKNTEKAAEPDASEVAETEE